jgi:hypothetical protein
VGAVALSFRVERKAESSASEAALAGSNWSMTSTERGSGSSAEAVGHSKDANRQRKVAAIEHMPRQIRKAAVGGAKWCKRTGIASWFSRTWHFQQAYPRFDRSVHTFGHACKALTGPFCARPWRSTRFLYASFFSH